jgi:adenylate kinase
VAPLIVVLGPTGAGKTVQAKLLAKRRGLEHISTGDLVRASREPAVIAQANTGALIKSSDVEALLAAALRKIKPGRGVVLDGFPRLLDELEWLETHLTEFNLELTKVIYIVISRQEALLRIMGRGRDDDSLLSVEEKWREYEEQTEPVINRYRQTDRLIAVNGVGTVTEVNRRIAAALG